jgi:hypothetical protein
MLNNSIKQRLKILEQIVKQNEPYKPRLHYYFETAPNEHIYKIPKRDLDYFENIKDADKLEFNNEQECKDFLDTNADKIKLSSGYTENDVHKAKILLIRVVDNSHLERFMYECNRQDFKGG